MKKGCFSWFGHVLPLAERFALIRAHGFDLKEEARKAIWEHVGGLLSDG